MPAIAITIAQLLLQFGPSVAQAFQKLFSNPSPTQNDWDEVWKLTQTPWKDRQPDIMLPLPVLQGLSSSSSSSSH